MTAAGTFAPSRWTSTRIPAVPVAGSRQRFEQCALDVVVVFELELGAAPIQELEPGRAIYCPSQTDNRLGQ